MVTVRDENNIPEFIRRLNDLARYELQVGIFGEDDTEILTIAYVHEYGAPRANIPERSFIRTTFDQKENEITETVETMIGEVISGGMDARAAYDAIGAQITGMIQQQITDIRRPPNSPQTIAEKGSSNPLIDTGRLRSSVTFRVVAI